jgi:hypothetical protein
MYPIQSHEIRAIWQAEAIRAAQEAKMAGAVKVRRAPTLSALISRFVPLRRNEIVDCSAPAYAPNPC